MVGFELGLNSTRMKLDSFAEIAARRTTTREGLKAPEPIGKPGNTLSLEAPDAPSDWPRLEKIETQEALEKELQCQRARYAPFLQRLAPAQAFIRKKVTLIQWNWRIETAEDQADFSSVLAGEGSWESVTIPHYGGPVGRAVAFYRTEIEVPRLENGAEWVLCFEAADYVARVYCNGRCVGQHEGFYAPFEFAVGAYLVPDALNTIVVELHNDAVCKGVKLDDGTMVDGDKLYAATGLGWDDPQRGWHHCPPGMGIFGVVKLESRAHSWISHAWVRTLDLEGDAEVFLEISGRNFVNPPVTVEVAVYGENFEQIVREATLFPLPHPVGRGANLYRFNLQIDSPRLWQPDSPWLYSLQVTLRADDIVLDAHHRTFGLRTFEFDTDCDPKGRFLLNGKELRLMGANTMGFEQQDVLRGDFDQLRDDILLARMCNINFLRFTQRPVQEAVYDMCDRLGLMAQSDLPHFAMLRRPQFAEAVRQAGEMERLICPHPCNVLVSYFNEPFPAEWNVPPSRHLTRDELERFFTATDQMILSVNPDRVIKPVDGDYDPPAPGLPDNHAYTLWYVGHGIDSGALHAGHWMPIKPGWNYGCGEFGAEGLDFMDLMHRRYPGEWLPKTPEEESNWSPSCIIDAQTGTHFCFFYDRPSTVEGWVQASHAHQAFTTRWMTNAFRRDRRMVSFAIHLFIDAWPAGWMKTIMDCERRAKPAWFAYRDSLSPIHISVRMDRLTCCAGEIVPAELWIANDSGKELCGAEVRYRILDGARVVAEGREGLPAVGSPGVLGVGLVPFRAPMVDERWRFQIEAIVIASDSKVLHEAATSIEVFPKVAYRSETVPVISGFSIDWLPTNFSQKKIDVKRLLPGQTAVCCGSGPLLEQWPELLRKVREGARVVVLNLPPGTWEITESEKAVIEACGMGSRHFVSRATGHPLVNGFQPDDFRFWYDDEHRHIAPLLNNLIVGEGGIPVLSSGQLAWGQPLTVADAVREYAIGEGALLLCCLELKGRMANPVAREFLERLIQPCRNEQEFAELPNVQGIRSDSNFQTSPVLNER